MIPLELSISGFLSYRDPVEINFDTFDLACIAGSNGAGKSSLLDAITWALFGQARKRDDSVINMQSNSARVEIVFQYEDDIYRVERTKTREKTMLLEFHILETDRSAPSNGSKRLKRTGAWRPLTEHSLRVTEARIQATLRMDYETFINASFFLQGRADQFTQQKPSDRKRILSSILGLEVWERYKETAADRRKSLEADVRTLDGRLGEIQTELAEETVRKTRLKELEDSLQKLDRQRQTQEALVANARQVDASIKERERLVQALERQVQAAGQRMAEDHYRLAARKQEQQELADTLAHAAEIEAAYAEWQASLVRLEAMDRVAAQFREQERAREAPRGELQAARARLEQEQSSLLERKAQVDTGAAEIDRLKASIAAEQLEATAAEARLERRARLDEFLQEARQRQAEARAENPRLKAEMEELKERINHLSTLEGAECPLCGQPLGADERQALIERLTTQGTEMGARYRANISMAREIDEELHNLEMQIQELTRAEAELRTHTQVLAQAAARLETLETACQEWDARGASRLREVQTSLRDETYAPEARLCLDEIDAELKKIGYDAAAHDDLRRQAEASRSSETSLRELEKARAALVPLEREIDELQTQLAAQQAELDRQSKEHSEAAEGLALARQQAPDLYTAENLLFQIIEEENHARLDVGAARQKVLVLDDLKERQKTYTAEREALSQQISHLKKLERAFSKDGVPALLIEQALPEIEARANDILARLTSGSMTVRFVTQAQYKDKNRDDLRETLDIQISDGAGIRDYEMYSGGEAFRVNFAIRLALSEVLAQRSGAHLQTLVIDEGFGSQDVQGRQRLVEAISLVRPNFRKILVITHIDELKDAFPNRIEVEKTDRGSTIRVV